MATDKKIVKNYEKDDLTIVWKPAQCIHSAICAKGLQDVFRPNERPWIVPEAASADAIKAQIDQCPSGALGYLEKDEKEESAERTTAVLVQQGGPLLVSGSLQITKVDGQIENREGNTAFCRCGASANKPFCDGSHRDIEFQ